MDKKTLVFGASLREERYSNIAINKLIAHQVPVVAYGLKSGIVNGVSINTALVSYDDIDTITLYVGAKRQKEYYDYLISLNPKRILFNPGTENSELYKLLEENNITYEVACTLVLLSTNQY